MLKATPRFAAYPVLGLAVFGVCYGASQWQGDPAVVSSVWPANAIALAFILRLCRTRPEAAAALAMAGLGMVAANLLADRAGLTTLGFPIGNMIEIGLATWFLRDVTMPMSRPSDLKQFFLGAVVAGPLASSLIAGLVLALAYGTSGTDLMVATSRWLLSDMMGMAIVAPVLLSLSQIAPGRWVHALRAPVIIGLVMLIAATLTRLPVVLLAFPLAGLAALQDRERGAALGVGAIAIAILIATTLGRGPVANLEGMGVELAFVIQAFLACLVLTVYPLAALVRRQDQLAAELERRRLRAEDVAEDRGRMLGEAGAELRSPLSGVLTVAEMLRSGRLGDLNPRQVELLTRIAESGAEIEALSREMTARSRGEPGDERRARIDHAVAQAIQGTRFRAAGLGVNLAVLDAGPDVEARIEPTRLARLLADWIAASVVATPEDGVVQVSVEADAERIMIHIDDEDAGDLGLRLAEFALQSRDPAASGIGYDRAELRRGGGDLRLVRRDGAGLRTTLEFRIAPPARHVA